MSILEFRVRVRPVDILLVESGASDRVFSGVGDEAIKRFRAPHFLHRVEDGDEARDFLRARGRHAKAPRPDLVLFDIGASRRLGLDLLAEMKADAALRTIPAIVLGRSDAEEAVSDAYMAHANAYVAMPDGSERLAQTIRALEEFWLETAVLPPARSAAEAGGGGERPLAPLSDACRVLLVEDDPAEAVRLEEALSESKTMRFATERADRLVGAIERLRAGGFDVVVTEPVLPDGDGDQTLRRLTRAAGDTPVIVLTATDDEGRGLELLRDGARDCVVKGGSSGPALGRALRRAVDRARMEERLHQAQRMESIGVLAGGVAHDFNNLLTIVRGNAELIAGARLGDTATAAAARQIVAAADRGAMLTRQLLAFSRRERMRPEPVELNAALEGLRATLRRVLGPGIELEMRFSTEPLPIVADPGMIEQVAVNLALNARDAMSGGGRFTLVTRRVELGAGAPVPRPPAGPGAYALLAARDTGAGIPAEALPHVFEPFFTTKEPGRGSGLGLATVYGVVRQHRGDVEARNETGGGAEFRVWLPLSSTSGPSAAPRQADEAPARGSGETILLVDDEAMVREMAAIVLRMQGYEVIEAESGEAALARWDEIGARTSLLLTDLLMPEMTGDRLAEILQAKKPGLRVVYSSGHAGAARKDLRLVDGVNHVPKPYTLDSLAGVVKRALHPGREVSE